MVLARGRPGVSLRAVRPVLGSAIVTEGIRDPLACCPVSVRVVGDAHGLVLLFVLEQSAGGVVFGAGRVDAAAPTWMVRSQPADNPK